MVGVRVGIGVGVRVRVRVRVGVRVRVTWKKRQNHVRLLKPSSQPSSFSLVRGRGKWSGLG